MLPCQIKTVSVRRLSVRISKIKIISKLSTCLRPPKNFKNSLQKKAPNLRRKKKIPTGPNLKEFWNKEKRKKKKKNR